MNALVLDTSVVIKWFSDYDENDLEKALQVRRGIADGDYSAIVPDLLYYEFANALRYNARLTSKDVSHAVQSILDMGFDARTPEMTIMTRALDLAFKHQITIYDSYFLALAQTENKALVTADYKMAARVKTVKNIIRLSDF